jgi:hypothetical protein
VLVPGRPNVPTVWVCVVFPAVPGVEVGKVRWYISEPALEMMRRAKTGLVKQDAIRLAQF